ncbi:unnamed protein product [Colias eurytheme]|nr:unnamed protein product [Colias eurytheme]
MHKIRPRLGNKQWSITLVAPGFVARSETIEAVRWARYRPVITLMHRVRKRQIGTRARFVTSLLMAGATRIRDPHSATVRAIKPVYVKNFNSLTRVTTGRAFLAPASPARKKRSAPGAHRKCMAGTRTERTHRLN